MGISAKCIWISARYLDISQASGFAYLHFLSNGAKKTLILNKDEEQVTRGICHESVKCFGLGSKFSRITATDYAFCVIRRIKGVVGFK